MCSGGVLKEVCCCNATFNAECGGFVKICSGRVLEEACCCNVNLTFNSIGYFINRSVRLKTRYPGKAVLIDNRLEPHHVLATRLDA